MWLGMDETIAEEITGNIKLETANEKQFDLIGNQNIKYQEDGKEIIPTKN